MLKRAVDSKPQTTGVIQMKFQWLILITHKQPRRRSTKQNPSRRGSKMITAHWTDDNRVTTENNSILLKWMLTFSLWVIWTSVFFVPSYIWAPKRDVNQMLFLLSFLLRNSWSASYSTRKLTQHIIHFYSHSVLVLSILPSGGHHDTCTHTICTELNSFICSNS